VRAAFDRLETAELELRTLRRGGGVLQLAILPTYGTRWLIPRFPSFAEAHPDVQVHFTTKLQPFDFASRGPRRGDPPRRRRTGPARASTS
jgi:LysR family glycine cleavage system transcriptional activator